MHDTGTSSIVYNIRYWISAIVTLQYWYFQYCKYYNTGNTSIVNITILVLPVLWPAASYYPIFQINTVMIKKYVRNYSIINKVQFGFNQISDF